VATQKKMAPGVAAAVKSGRSTSSLSSKEAEYQVPIQPFQHHKIKKRYQNLLKIFERF